MLSSIKVDFADNGRGLEPVIAVKLIPSDDVRDFLLQTFFQKLGGTSSWLRVHFQPDFEGQQNLDNIKYIKLYPVPPAEMPENLKEMEARIFLQNAGTLVANELKEGVMSHLEKKEGPVVHS